MLYLCWRVLNLPAAQRPKEQLEEVAISTRQAHVWMQFDDRLVQNQSLMELLLRSCHCLRAEPGESLLRPGKAATEFFLIVHGVAQVNILSRKRETVCLRRLYRGGYFGEDVAVEQNEREETVVAVEPTTCIVWPASVFREHLQTFYDEHCQEKISFLRKCPSLRFLPRPIVSELAWNSQFQRFDAGQVIVQQGWHRI